jgi:hypothetical protein
LLPGADEEAMKNGITGLWLVVTSIPFSSATVAVLFAINAPHWQLGLWQRKTNLTRPT